MSFRVVCVHRERVARAVKPETVRIAAPMAHSQIVRIAAPTAHSQTVRIAAPSAHSEPQAENKCLQIEHRQMRLLWVNS